MAAQDESSEAPLNWTAVAALYAGLSVGIVGMLYWGQYRNAAWLILIGTGGGLTAYARVLDGRGREKQAQRWQWGAGAAYAVFFLWAGTVLIRVWLGL